MRSCVRVYVWAKSMTRLLAKLELWIAVSTLLRIINKVQSYAAASETLLNYRICTVHQLGAKFTNDHSTGCAATMETKHHKKAPGCVCVRVCVRMCVYMCVCVYVCVREKRLASLP